MPHPFVAEAQRLRDLGRYPDALSKYREAQVEQDGMVLRTEIASMFLEQGLAGQCHEELVGGRASFEDAETDAKALADMLLFISATATTVHFSTNVQGAAALYTCHLADREPEAYGRIHVSP